jgi:uncharacterized protein YbcV (DUF1398 family)
VTHVVNRTADEVIAAQMTGFGRVLANQQGAAEYHEFRENLARAGNIERDF